MPELNFNNTAKKYLRITLKDKNKTVINVSNPSKKLLKELINVDKMIKNENIEEEEQIGILYELCAKILSRNKESLNINKDLLEDILDIEDIITFFKAYLEFINTQIKN